MDSLYYDILILRGNFVRYYFLSICSQFKSALNILNIECAYLNCKMDKRMLSI